MTDSTPATAALRCWADITLRDSEHQLIRCGRGVEHDGAHVGRTDRNEFVEWTDRDVTGIHKDPATGGSA